MNVLHLSRTMDQGGAEKIVYQLAIGSCKQGNHVFVASSGGVYTEQLREQHVCHYEIHDLECKNPRVMIHTMWQLIQIVKTERIDIIHTHHRMAALYAYLLKFIFPKVQLVYTAHNVFFNRKFLTRLTLSRSKIVAVGESVKDNLINFFKIDSKRIKVIYNAVQSEEIDDDYYNDQMMELKSQKNILVGIIGRLSEQKGVDIFIQALRMVKEKIPYVKGIIIGDGELKEYLRRMINELGMANEIFMLGYQEHISTLISQLDLVVMPSRWEGFPLTPIEVFERKKTLVASNIGGINEIVSDQENGLLVPADDVQLFSKAIIRILQDNELRTKLEENGKKYYESHFDYQNFLKQYHCLYQKMLSEVSR